MTPKSIIDQETTIKEFLDRSRQLMRHPLTIATVVDYMTSNYRDQRVDGANVDSSGDMLLLEWGSARLLQTAEPIDFRGSQDSGTPTYTGEVTHFAITRQVHVDTGGPDDFDGNAISMYTCLTVPCRERLRATRNRDDIRIRTERHHR